MSGDLKACEGGILVRCLPPKLQMRLILDDVSNIPFYFRRIEPLLPLLDENMLVRTRVTYTHTRSVWSTESSLLSLRSCSWRWPAYSILSAMWHRRSTRPLRGTAVPSAQLTRPRLRPRV
jgi:hypothetical protein